MNAEPNLNTSSWRPAPKRPVSFPPIQTPLPTGDAIREMRLDLGFKQRELAELAGISQAALSDIETGAQMRPKPETLAKIEKALGLAPGVLKAGFEDDRQAASAAFGGAENELELQLTKAHADLRQMTAERDASLKAEHEFLRKLRETQGKLFQADREIILFDLERDQAKIELERVNGVRKVELSTAFWRGAVTGAVAMLAALGIAVLAVLA